MIRDLFPKEYSQRAKDAPSAKKIAAPEIKFDADAYVNFGLGCDGCGLLPIRGRAWYDADCPEKAGFHLCDACYKLGFHRRVLTGRFNQTHMPTNTMKEVETPAG